MTLWKLRDEHGLSGRARDSAVRDGLPDAQAPTLSCIVETSVYVSDLHAARDFYARVLGLEVLLSGSRLLALRVGGLSVLLLFQRSAPLAVPARHGIVQPGADGGVQQLWFAISPDAVSTWIDRLHHAGVPIEKRTSSPRGGESICIRDPDGHAVELVAPGLWESG